MSQTKTTNSEAEYVIDIPKHVLTEDKAKQLKDVDENDSDEIAIEEDVRDGNEYTPLILDKEDDYEMLEFSNRSKKEINNMVEYCDQRKSDNKLNKRKVGVKDNNQVNMRKDVELGSNQKEDEKINYSDAYFRMCYILFTISVLIFFEYISTTVIQKYVIVDNIFIKILTIYLAIPFCITIIVLFMINVITIVIIFLYKIFQYIKKNAFVKIMLLIAIFLFMYLLTVSLNTIQYKIYASELVKNNSDIFIYNMLLFPTLNLLFFIIFLVGINYTLHLK